MMSTGPAVPARTIAFDAAAIRQDFPLLRQRVRSKPLVHLDNAATTQKPQTVIDRVVRYYAEENANVHRGVHWLSERATEEYENARATVGRFLNARDSREIVFVRGTTEAINLVASTYGRAHVSRGDEVVLSAMEHHSNIVPWQLLCEQQGARLRVIPVSDAGELDLEAYATLLNDRTRIVSVVHVSNALGTINPVEQIVRLAHRRGIPVVVDGAQAAAHMRIGVQALGCEFYALSGHKVFGPTGIGVLYGTSSVAENDAAVSGRRRHDQLGQLRADPLQAAATPVRGGDAAHRKSRRSRGRDRVPHGNDTLHHRGHGGKPVLLQDLSLLSSVSTVVARFRR